MVVINRLIEVSLGLCSPPGSSAIPLSLITAIGWLNFRVLGPRFADAKPVGIGSPLHLPVDKLGSAVVHGVLVAQGCPRKFSAPFCFLFISISTPWLLPTAYQKKPFVYSNLSRLSLTIGVWEGTGRRLNYCTVCDSGIAVRYGNDRIYFSWGASDEHCGFPITESRQLA